MSEDEMVERKELFPCKICIYREGGPTAITFSNGNGARQFGEPGIFVAFEENSRHILANAASFGWNFPKLEKKQLFFFDAKMGPDVIKAGEFDLSGMLAGIKRKSC